MNLQVVLNVPETDAKYRLNLAIALSFLRSLGAKEVYRFLDFAGLGQCTQQNRHMLHSLFANLNQACQRRVP